MLTALSSGMLRAAEMASRCTRSMLPAFSTTTWTLTSGRICVRAHAMVGTAKKSTESGPQSPCCPWWAPAQVSCPQGEPATMITKHRRGSFCANCCSGGCCPLSRSQTSAAMRGYGVTPVSAAFCVQCASTAPAKSLWFSAKAAIASLPPSCRTTMSVPTLAMPTPSNRDRRAMAGEVVTEAVGAGGGRAIQGGTSTSNSSSVARCSVAC